MTVWPSVGSAAMQQHMSGHRNSHLVLLLIRWQKAWAQTGHAATQATTNVGTKTLDVLQMSYEQGCMASGQHLRLQWNRTTACGVKVFFVPSLQDSIKLNQLSQTLAESILRPPLSTMMPNKETVVTWNSKFFSLTQISCWRSS